MPMKSDRGRVARAILYFMTMYDDVKLEQVSDLATLKKWHAAYPPSQFEKIRNDRVNLSQGNRNPYIDHPEYVDMVFP